MVSCFFQLPLDAREDIEGHRRIIRDQVTIFLQTSEVEKCLLEDEVGFGGWGWEGISLSVPGCFYMRSFLVALSFPYFRLVNMGERMLVDAEGFRMQKRGNFPR